MNERNYALVGLFAPLIAVFFIALSIALSPWFSWWNNALSDLGHSVDSEVAPLFNFGLLLSGFLTVYYSVASFNNHAKFTSYFLVIVGLMLQLVATFDEVYGFFHFLVSVLFFLALGFATISYMVEKRSLLAFAAFVIGSVTWVFYGIKIYSAGIAVPEIISSMVAASWVMLSALRIYLNKTGENDD